MPDDDIRPVVGWDGVEALVRFGVIVAIICAVAITITATVVLMQALIR